MTAALVVALIQALGPGAIDLIETWLKDPNTEITPEMFAAMKAKRNTPFSDLAGPK